MLNIVFDKFKKTDIITASFLVMAGRRYEQKSEYQYSHLLEHLLTLKGSKNYSFLTANNIIKKFGGVVKSSTNSERTRFIIQGQSNYFSQILKVFLDSIFYPKFSNKIFENEKLVLIQENNIRYKNPENILVDKILSSIFGENNFFSKSKEKLILDIKLNKIIDFYKKHYQDSNYVFLISNSGLNKYDLEIKNIFESYSNKFKNSKTQDKTIPQEINFNSPKEFFQFRKSNNYSIFIYYLFKIDSIKQSICLDLISNYLSFGQDSKFYKKLRFNRGLIYGIKTTTNHKSDCSLFLIYTNTLKYKEVVKIILDQIKEIKINNKILEDLKNQTKGYLLRSFFNPLNKLEIIEYLWLKNEKNLTLNFYLKLLEEINLDDINELIKLLSIKSPIIGIVGPSK